MEGLLKGSTESDLYSLSVIEELLRSQADWTGTAEILQLTIKALFDSLRLQAQAVQEIQRTIPTKASKAEMNAGLAQKANISDVSRTIAEIASSVEGKVGVEEMRSAVKEKVSYKELQEILQGKARGDEMKVELDKKVSCELYSAEIKEITWKIDSLKRDLEMKSISQASARDVEEIRMEVQRKANIADVNAALQQKAGKEGVANALKRKANLADVETGLSYKADAREVERVLKVVNEKVSLVKLNELQNNMEKLKESIKEHTTAMEVNNAIKDSTSSLNERLSKLQAGIEEEKAFTHEAMRELRKLIKDKADTLELEPIKLLVNQKADIKNTGKELVELKAATSENLKQINKRVDIMVGKFEELKKVIGKSIEDNYSDMTRLKQQILTCSEDTSKLVDRTNLCVSEKMGSKEDQVALRRSIADIRKVVDDIERNKVNRRDLQAEIENKCETKNKSIEGAISKVKEELGNRLTEVEINVDRELKAIQGKVNKVFEEKLNEKADIADIDNSVMRVLELRSGKEFKLTDVSKEIAELSKQLEMKVSAKEIIQLISSKANAHDLLKFVEEVREEIANSTKSVEKTLADQALINETLCAENCTVRWLWKSGTLKSGYAIPWEVQSVNTCPENFLWERGKTFVVAVASGLYEVALGLFASKSPEVELLVNGEVVISIGKTGRNTVKSKSTIAGMMQIKCLGTTLIDFLSLPPKANIMVTYNGEAEAEGFLGLRKL
eukprot:TRINITY_DN16038_c0_g2_i1.p1 TRINITY_DN16038_c0_g2~~TRINITY_DN16038_c0_g2_i1.p1  ORF type:complete len:730 (-),score=190.07 TRINITY_DN16038_c0_g2_i1:42-2231(-)